MKKSIHAILAAAALCAATSVAEAQDYPTRPVTLIVPYAAGGPSDTIGRLIAEQMSKTLGRQIVVENVTGAGGTIGAARAARAQADGYTLLIHHLALAAGASLYKNSGYDTLSAFEPIGLVNYGPFVMVTRKDYPAKDIKELLARFKSDAEKVRLANAGTGSGSHLCGLLLGSALSVKFTEVPYRGTGPALQDVVAGNVDALCDQTTNAIPQIQGGTVKAFAVTSLERVAQLPNLPTMNEAGVKGFEITVWHALYAPRGTPKPIVEKLNGALEKALAEPTVLARFEQLGTQLFPAGKRGPDALAARLKSEVELWSKVIAAAGVVGN